MNATPLKRYTSQILSYIYILSYIFELKTGIKIIFEEITGIRSQVPAIFNENNETVLGDFN